MKPPRPVMVVCGLLLAAVGVTLLSVAIAMPSPHVTAVPVPAITQTGLTRDQCANGGSVRVSFVWAGQPVTESLDSPNCTLDYPVGQRVDLYAASNDPANLGTTSDWILNPDEHDPFDFIGPNGLPTFIRLVGAGIVIGGGILCYFGWERRRQAATIVA